jgi:hypothetical protein
MMQTGGLQTGNEFPTSATIQQNTSLLGSPQIQSQTQGAFPTFNTGMLNSTAPSSSTTNPNVANMVKALRGGT